MKRHFVPIVVAVGLILFIGTVSSPSSFIGRVVESLVPSRTVVTCTDTDGGNDYTARGKVTLVLRDGQTRWAEDRCLNGQNLHEYNCPQDNSPKYELHVVRCACRDGSCRS